jgi:hypothetical protein
MTTGQARDLYRDLTRFDDAEIDQVMVSVRRAVNQYHDQMIAEEESNRLQQSGK